MSTEQRIEDLRGHYAGSWDHLLTVPTDRPVTLVNLFAFREVADYGLDDEPGVSGADAFGRYAAVSGPALEAVGDRFVHVGSHQGNLVGDDEAWDLVVIGEYPDLNAVLALHEREDYRDAYRHRIAACARQQVVVSA